LLFNSSDAELSAAMHSATSGHWQAFNGKAIKLVSSDIKRIFPNISRAGQTAGTSLAEKTSYHRDAYR
ncbi:hypothetical protein, partial [Pseudomonas aeruginosa]|uniref:hypothetical protein n=1 Tax=Pseudomonas aeruginosa TaxID=287 RepID=UPI003D2D3FE6